MDLDIHIPPVQLVGICGEEKSFLTQRTFSNQFMWVTYKRFVN